MPMLNNIKSSVIMLVNFAHKPQYILPFCGNIHFIAFDFQLYHRLNRNPTEFNIRLMIDFSAGLI